MKQSIGTPEDISKSLNNLGSLYGLRGDLAKAESFFRRSLDIREKLGNEQDISRAMSNLGELCLIRGEIKEAEKFLQRALNLCEKHGTSNDIARLKMNLGKCCLHAGLHNKTEMLWRRSLALYDKVGTAQEVSEAVLRLFRISLLHGAVEEAENLLARLEHIAQENQQVPDVIIRHKLALGQFSLKRHELGTATSLLRSARDLASQIPHFPLLTEASLLLVQALIQKYLLTKHNEPKTEIKALLQGLETISTTKHLHGTSVETLLLQGLLQRTELDLDGAQNLFKAALLRAEKLGLKLLKQKAEGELSKLHDQMKLVAGTSKTLEESQMKEMLSYIQEISSMEQI